MGIRAEIIFNGLNDLAEIIETFKDKDFLIRYLREQGYVQVKDNLYRKVDELLEVFKSKTEWHYRNLDRPGDTGTIVNFIANRLSNDNSVISRHDVLAVSIASILAKKFIKDHESQIQFLARSLHKKGTNNRPIDEKASKRRRK